MSHRAAPQPTTTAHTVRVTGTYVALAGLAVFFGFIVIGAGGYLTGHWAAAMQAGAGVLVLIGVLAAAVGVVLEMRSR